MNENLAAFLWYFGFLMDIVRPAVLAALLWGLWIALGRARFNDSERITTWLAVGLPLGAWFASVWVLAEQGAFVAAPGGVSPLPIAVLLPIAIALFGLTRSERIAAAVDAIAPRWLIGIQFYRVLGGNFIVLWAFGAVPGVFALPAGIGDMLVGILALPVAIYLASGAPGGRAAAVGWNLLGIADLVNAVTLGVLSASGPQQMLAFGHPNTLTATYPTVMIPAFAVPLSLILHGLSLWQLRRRQRQSPLKLAGA